MLTARASLIGLAHQDLEHQIAVRLWLAAAAAPLGQELVDLGVAVEDALRGQHHLLLRVRARLEVVLDEHVLAAERLLLTSAHRWVIAI